jgi:N-acyl homoserine lactone hydrolase
MGPARGQGKGQRVVALEVKRLHLGATPGDTERWPVHGFVVTYPDGAALVDTGVGGPPDLIRDWEVVNITAADALAGLGLVPGDIDLVINTHLHFDHCGQNAVFKHAAFYVQRAELDRCRRDSPALYDWFDFQNASFELLDGDAEIRPGLSVITTPGHTFGHQSVLVAAEDGGPDLLIGDAAYTPRQYRPEPGRLPPGQAADEDAWHASVNRMRALAPARVHFCHHTEVVHG